MITSREVPVAIAERREFQASNMRGSWDDFPGSGIMPDEQYAEMRQFMRNHDMAAIYVVYSYSTPIAYGNHARLIIPDVKYSQITSRHQSLVKRAL